MTPTRRVIAAAASLLLASGALLTFAGPVAAAKPGDPCVSGSLALAPTLAGDIGRDGQPVRVTPLADGTTIPVVMVHGWIGRSIHDDARTGAFSGMIDLTANMTGTASVGRSLIGQVQDAGGTSVYTFDYHDASARWVTDAAIAPKLAEAISCLSTSHGHPAVLMVHSMGGLAARQALSLLEKQGRTGLVSDVVTFGTPNTGSWLASAVDGADKAATLGQLLPGTTGPAIAAVRSILTLCGTRTTASMNDSGACGLLGPELASARSDAGRALRVNSPQIRALPAWPRDVRVLALGGSIDLEVARVGWFNLSASVGDVNVGDFVVGVDSATARATSSNTIACHYTLDIRAAVEDNIAADWLKLKAASETRDNLYTNGAGSACAHGNLTRSVELTADALGAIADVVDEANREAIVPTELGGTWCTRSGQPPLGRDKACFSFADLMTQYPRATVEIDKEHSSYGSYSPNGLPGVWGVYVCLHAAPGDEEPCSMPDVMGLDYFPAGVRWNCQAFAAGSGMWSGCDPDFTAAHDPTRPRLVMVPNHQMNDAYADSEPLYRQ